MEEKLMKRRLVLQGLSVYTPWIVVVSSSWLGHFCLDIMLYL